MLFVLAFKPLAITQQPNNIELSNVVVLLLKFQSTKQLALVQSVQMIMNAILLTIQQRLTYPIFAHLHICILIQRNC